jgi:hypothetical protein
MRKGQRFTPARLFRWHNNGRGTGTGADYQPWHQVTRDDPSSRGRSHLINWRFGRLHHLLSDLELVAFGFASMLPSVMDLREQFPLAHDEHLQELATYQVGGLEQCAPGTLQIAHDLGHRHPLVRKNEAEQPWVMTTDLVLTLRNQIGRTELLATDAEPDLINRCSALAGDIEGRSWRQCVEMISSRFAVDTHAAQCVMWQSIWSGRLPINLSRALRLNEPLELLSLADFWQQNPIASRRTAWPRS